ncbi:hypothetical protein [Erythrobacter crassostreae]|nr:hypothetical protein [Erythrobacter crassostrea]
MSLAFSFWRFFANLDGSVKAIRRTLQQVIIPTLPQNELHRSR